MWLSKGARVPFTHNTPLRPPLGMASRSNVQTTNLIQHPRKEKKKQETQIHHTHLDVGKVHLFETQVVALVANCSQVWNLAGSHNHNHPWMSHLSQELEMNPGNWMTLSIK